MQTSSSTEKNNVLSYKMVDHQGAALNTTVLFPQDSSKMFRHPLWSYTRNQLKIEV